MNSKTVVGLGVILLGYSVFYYGLTQVQSGNWGYLDLVLPTRWQDPAVVNIARDGQAGVTSETGTTSSTDTSTKNKGPGFLNTLRMLVPNG